MASRYRQDMQRAWSRMAAYGWERLWWWYRRLLPSLYARMIGVPKGYQPTPEDADTIRAVSELQFPLKPRKLGAVFDGFVSNMVADRFPFEEPSPSCPASRPT